MVLREPSAHFKLKGSQKYAAACGPMRLRAMLLACIVFMCALSLVMFHVLLVRWGDCLEFNNALPNTPRAPSSDPDNLRRSPHWDFFDHIYVLHSSLAVERRESIHDSINKLHLQDDVHWWDTEIDYENGHRGTWMSHKSIAQHAFANNFSKILVFEDDIKIEPFLARGVDAVMQRAISFLHVTPSWEVFYLSHNCKRMELTNNPEIVHVNSWSTVAFALQGKAIEVLAESGYDKRTTVDSLLFKNKHAYAIYPMPIEHTPNYSYTEKANRTEVVNEMWRYEERVLYEDALKRNTFACSSAPRRAWGHFLYSPPFIQT